MKLMLESLAAGFLALVAYLLVVFLMLEGGPH